MKIKVHIVRYNYKGNKASNLVISDLFISEETGVVQMCIRFPNKVEL